MQRIGDSATAATATGWKLPHRATAAQSTCRGQSVSGGRDRTAETVAAVQRAAEAVARRNRNPAIRQAAEDISQDAAAAFVTRALDRTCDDPAAWGAVVARNRIVDLLRRGRWTTPVDWDTATGTVWQAILERGAPVSDPAVLATARVDAVRLLRRLSERERQLMLLVAQGYPHREIAEMLGYANARTVTATLHRIRRALTGERSAWTNAAA